MAYSSVYKGARLRSLLELSVIRNLEASGLVLGESMLYETTRIPYGKTRKHTYIVDLTLPFSKTLVEVKPSSRADNRNNRAKRAAAEAWALENGWTYVMVTEQELAKCGETITLEQASSISGVVLNERALRSLRRQRAAKSRKMRRKGQVTK